MDDRHATTHVFVTLGVLAAAIGALLAGRLAVSGLAALVFLVAYAELRAVVDAHGRRTTLVIGGIAVLASLWVAYEGDLQRLAWVGASLVLVLLIAWLVIHEATGVASGATRDIASTVFAAGVVGVLGGHVLLIRSIERFGFRGLVAFGLMVLAWEVAGIAADRVVGRRRLGSADQAAHTSGSLAPGRTWEGLAAALVVTTAVGAIVGFTIDPPFDPRSGAGLGAGVGVVTPLGVLAFATLRRDRPSRSRSAVFGGTLAAVDGLLFAAPMFYWAFRTIAL